MYVFKAIFCVAKSSSTSLLNITKHLPHFCNALSKRWILTFVMLNLFWEANKIFPFSIIPKVFKILCIEFHGCWWWGEAMGQGISSHGGLVILKYSYFCTKGVKKWTELHTYIYIYNKYSRSWHINMNVISYLQLSQTSYWYMFIQFHQWVPIFFLPYFPVHNHCYPWQVTSG